MILLSILLFKKNYVIFVQHTSHSRIHEKTLLSVALILGLSGLAQATDLLNVTILATGGTITGATSSNTETTDYNAAAVGIETSINIVPEKKQYADVTGEQVVKISSNNLTDKVLLTLAKHCNELLAKDDVHGIVITHLKKQHTS